MISELKDDEIMDFLMTSDFEGDYKPEEFKYLLYKWRYFYRLLYGKNDLFKVDSEFEIKKLNQQQEDLKKSNTQLLVDLANKQNMINGLVNRNLTWKERFSGKIITNNEDK